MATAQSTGNITEQEAYEIGVEAYQYFYPMISMDVTRRVTTNMPEGAKPGMGPMNAFHHMRVFPTADFREVVRPNFDTLYSIGWLDPTKEPMIVTAPDTSGRCYLSPMMDMWSDVFAVPGKRTSGTGAASFAIVSKGWNGKLPKGVERIEAPTSYVWIIGRTQTNGPKDYENVHKVQDGYTITPLSQRGKKVTPVKAVIDPSVDMKTPPLVQVDTMPADKYFSYGADLMKRNPPHATDWSLVARLKRIGIEPGKSFDFDDAPPVIKASLERAVVAMTGLGANQPEDAIYPLCVADAEGKPLEGSNKYVLHFTKNELPPRGRSGRSRCTPPKASRSPTNWTASLWETVMN